MDQDTQDHAGAAPSPRWDSADDRADEGLVARFRQGDEAAFGEIVVRYRDRVYQFCRWQLGASRAEAEDATQDALLEVYRCLGSFEGRSRLKTWILGVARNVCRRRRRSRHRRESVELAQGREEAPLVELPDSSIDLLRDLERQEQERALCLAIERLSGEQRSTLLLRDVEGLSYEEIARVLGVPVGTVRSRLHNARGALARQLAAVPSSAQRERP